MEWNRIAWTRINELRAEGKTNYEIAQALGCSWSALQYGLDLARHSGVKIGPRARALGIEITPAEAEFLAAHYGKDMPVEEIRARLKRGSAWLKFARMKLGLADLHPRRGWKPTPEQEEIMRREMRRGTTWREIGELFGISTHQAHQRGMILVSGLKDLPAPPPAPKPVKPRRVRAPKPPREMIPQECADYLRAHYRIDQSPKEIGAALRRSPAWVGGAARQLGLHERVNPDRVPAPVVRLEPRVPQRSPEPLPAGHPVSWGILQSILSPELRDSYPEEATGTSLAAWGLSGVSRYRAPVQRAPTARWVGALDTIGRAA